MAREKGIDGRSVVTETPQPDGTVLLVWDEDDFADLDADFLHDDFEKMAEDPDAENLERYL